MMEGHIVSDPVCLKEERKACCDCNKIISPEATRCKSCAGKIHMADKKGSKHPCFGRTGEKHPLYGLRGINNPNYGSKRTKETCENIGRSKIGKMAGAKHPRWKGGITPILHSIRLCTDYKIWRLGVFERDHYTCTHCLDNRGGNLKAHHIHPLSKILIDRNIKNIQEARTHKILWDISNGITVCDTCHAQIHRNIINGKH